MTFTSRLTAMLVFVLVLTLGYATDLGRATAVALVALAIVSALTYYGHRATTLYLAERHRALLAQTRGTR
jgi:uncharacterized membrane protein YfbV (UPF0208 family)